MPLMHVTITAGAFDTDQRARLVEAFTDAACLAESVPSTPEHRMRALVLLHELAPGTFYSAGASADDLVAATFVDWYVSTGVLDGARKERFAQDVHFAVSAIAEDGRMPVTSCVIHEVPEGQWAQNGAIRRLPEVSHIAGFEHLASLTAPSTGLGVASSPR